MSGASPELARLAVLQSCPPNAINKITPAPTAKKAAFLNFTLRQNANRLSISFSENSVVLAIKINQALTISRKY